MSNWVPCYEDLMRGRKRALSRSARFVFLELCIEARDGGGLVELTPGLDLDESVHDILGGSRKEIAASLPALLAEEMLDATSNPGFLIVVNWDRWALKDKTNAERQARYRERKKLARNGATSSPSVTHNVTSNVTPPLRNASRSDQIRREKKRAAAKPLQDSKPRARKRKLTPEQSAEADAMAKRMRAAGIGTLDPRSLPTADRTPQADTPAGPLPKQQQQQQFSKNEQEAAEIRALREADAKARARIAAANAAGIAPASSAFAGALANLGGPKP